MVFLNVSNHPPPFSLTVSRSSATGSSGDEIGKALASVSWDSLVSAPQAVYKTDYLLVSLLEYLKCKC